MYVHYCTVLIVVIKKSQFTSFIFIFYSFINIIYLPSAHIYLFETFLVSSIFPVLPCVILFNQLFLVPVERTSVHDEFSKPLSSTINPR